MMKKKIAMLVLIALLLTGCSSQSYRFMETKIQEASNKLAGYYDAVSRYEEAMSIVCCYLYEYDESITRYDAMDAYDEADAAVQELIEIISGIEHSIE